MNLTKLDWLFAGSAAGVLGAAGLATFLRSRWRRDPEEVERRRREHVSRVGRIAQAEILDVFESDAGAAPARRHPFHRRRVSAAAPPLRRLLVVYRYTVSGVSYETAQDLSGFASSFQFSEAGQMVSVKYDQANPSNSILAAETWSGLRKPRRPATIPEKGA